MEMKLRGGRKTLVDTDVLEDLKRYKWCFSKGTGYAFRCKLDSDTPDTPKAIYLHRYLLDSPDSLVDHINGDRLDNRRENLRLCTRKGNSQNRRLHRDNKSGYKGVVWDKKRHVWVTYIGVNYKSKYLGSFEDIKDAAQAYNEAAVRYFGEFANPNAIE